MCIDALLPRFEISRDECEAHLLGHDSLVLIGDYMLGASRRLITLGCCSLFVQLVLG